MARALGAIAIVAATASAGCHEATAPRGPAAARPGVYALRYLGDWPYDDTAVKVPVELTRIDGSVHRVLGGALRIGADSTFDVTVRREYVDTAGVLHDISFVYAGRYRLYGDATPPGRSRTELTYQLDFSAPGQGGAYEGMLTAQADGSFLVYFNGIGWRSSAYVYSR